MSEEADFFIAVIAREMRRCPRVFLGANQTDAALAAALARRLWAPGLRVWSSGQAQIDQSRDAQLVGRATGDNLVVAERGATFMQARAFDDALRAPVVFAGGLQVDGRGNTNLAGIRDGSGWKLRGPGSAGLPTLTALAERFYVIAPKHEPRFLVDRCDLISVLGDPASRRAVGLRPDALVAVLTPLARFEPSERGLLLTEVTAGQSLDGLAQVTGFPLRIEAEVAERTAMEEPEKRALAELRSGMVKKS